MVEAVRGLPDTVAEVQAGIWNPLARLVEAQQGLSASSQLTVAGVQAGALGAMSDAFAQAMNGAPVDGQHTLAMGLLAALISGSLNAVWLQRLERTFPGSDTRAVLTKTLADYCIAAVIANSAYLAGVPLLTALLAGTPYDADLLVGWTEDGFRAVMLVEALTFLPYNLLAFRVVPPRLRPLSAAMVSATCTIFLSGVTLGCGV